MASHTEGIARSQFFAVASIRYDRIHSSRAHIHFTRTKYQTQTDAPYPIHTHDFLASGWWFTGPCDCVRTSAPVERVWVRRIFYACCVLGSTILRCLCVVCDRPNSNSNNTYTHTSVPVFQVNRFTLGRMVVCEQQQERRKYRDKFYHTRRCYLCQAWSTNNTLQCACADFEIDTSSIPTYILNTKRFSARSQRI